VEDFNRKDTMALAATITADPRRGLTVRKYLKNLRIKKTCQADLTKSWQVL
jgi:hypothetical protein